MKSKLSFSNLSHLKFLEIKMANILSFYEDIASSVAFKSDKKCFEIISIEDDTQNQQKISKPNSSTINAILNFTKPLQRSHNIVDYLIEREQRHSVKLTVSN